MRIVNPDGYEYRFFRRAGDIYVEAIRFGHTAELIAVISERNRTIRTMGDVRIDHIRFALDTYKVGLAR